jgi:hypothetical protein
LILGGFIMGGGGSSSSSFTPTVPAPQANYAAGRAGAIGDEMWSMTSPLRSSYMDIFSKFLNPNGGYNVSQLPGYAPQYNLMRDQVEGGYNAAKDNLLSTVPRGGALYGQLGNLESGRARSLGNTEAQLNSTFANDLFNKAYNTGFVVGPTTALTGLGIYSNDTRSGMNAQLAAQMQAQQMQALQAASNSQGKSSGMGGLGSGLGSIFGSVMGGSGSGGGGLGGMMGGKGGGGAGDGGITSGLGGYSSLMGQAMKGAGGFGG